MEDLEALLSDGVEHLAAASPLATLADIRLQQAYGIVESFEVGC